jgi:hypothetical protein
MFCAPGLIFGVRRASGLVLIFCAAGLFFGGTEGIGARFYVLCSETRFRQYRGHRVPFSCFLQPDSFLTVPGASRPIFMFCSPRLIFYSIDGVGYRFNVFRSRTHFRLYRARRVSFSCFALPDSFPAIPRASGPGFMFCPPRLDFGGTYGVWSRFHVLLSRTRFRRYRGRRVMFFMFCAPGLVFGGSGGIRSRFRVLRSEARFRRYRRRRVPFSCFALPDPFSAVPSASGPVFMYCAPGLIFVGTEGFRSRFHVLRSETHFRRYRRRRVSFSCFALADPYSAVPRASGYTFMFYAPRPVFCGTEGVWSRFYVLRL